jgi:ABC-type multidrug transport system fused ATPase/permease subunit
MSATQWLSLRLELASGLVVFFAAVFGCISRESSYYSANMMGLTLGYSFQVTQVINFCIKLFIESEIAMNQVERIDYFGTCLAQEKELHNNDIDLPNEWPQNGSIQIENLSARYSPDLPKVLKNVSLSINPGEKIGKTSWI